ncbi:unnamed protein product [Moneuplotes crassus]|uniref:Uncharacterized protein n=1 Tax=Euplotes crassus TaxID=5936 RepID=A0AAD1XLM4_EUPCR|nr:unnamed protein product [Moneuplotes crassus]
MEYVVSFLTAVIQKKEFKSCEEMKSFLKASKHLLSNEKQKKAHSKVCRLIELAVSQCAKLNSFSSTGDKKKQKKIKISAKGDKPSKNKIKAKKYSTSDENAKSKCSMKKLKKFKDLKKFTIQIKENFENQTRNNESDDCLSTINPNNPEKNVFHNNDITIKFTEDLREETNENPSRKGSPKVVPGHFKTRSQNIKSAHELERFQRKPPMVKQRPSFEDDMEPITLGEYMTNAKIAKEQKHKLTVCHTRSNSKKRLVNFFRPASSKETPNHKNRIEMRAEFNIQSLLKGKKKKEKKAQAHEDELGAIFTKKFLNYKTPPPELAQQMYFKRQ